MTLETKRSALLETRMFEDQAVTLEDGQCRLRIDHFALTTNNITYGVFGDMMRYWEVFPALDSPEAWGRIPTWGFAEVIESRCDDVPVGERIFGFLPMSAETVISPGRIDERGLSDVAPHRSGLAAPTTAISGHRPTRPIDPIASSTRWCCSRCSSRVS